MVTAHSNRRTRIAGVALALLALGGFTSTQAAAVTPAIAAPAGLQVVRTGPTATTLAITWKPVTGATRYTVNVFDGVSQFAYNVPSSQTSFTHGGTGNCTRYRVRVTAVDAGGGGATTNPFLLPPLAPGGITDVQLTRPAPGTTATLTWKAPPAGSSFTPVANYIVQFRSLVDNKVLIARTSPDTVEVVSGLEAARTYVTEIVPVNKWGFCNVSKVLVRGPAPSAPSNLKAVRDENDPTMVNLTWDKPIWTGYGPLTAVQVGTRRADQFLPTWVALPADATSARVRLDTGFNWSLWVRGANGAVNGDLSQEYKLTKPGAPGTPAINPSVRIDEAAGVVKVTFNAPVGSNATYPNMNVAIAPSSTDTGFANKQDAMNRAQTFTFDKVPCGAYTVVVTGYGPNASAEFGRKMINLCQSGLVPANQWKLVMGRATIAGNNVDMVFGNETRVVSTVPRTSPDMVYSTQATLTSGWGYGIWSRATLSGGAAMSGYTVQYDPGYQFVQPSFGKALLLRVWSKGSECGTPLARVKWPTGLEVAATHQITVVTKGDTLYATIDGIKMFDVPSLKAALAASRCNMPEPMGSQVGFRTWSPTGKATFRNTTIN